MTLAFALSPGARRSVARYAQPFGDHRHERDRKIRDADRTPLPAANRRCDALNRGSAMRIGSRRR